VISDFRAMVICMQEVQMSEMVERVARALARRGLSVNQVFYGGQRLDAELKPHTEDTLWPYYKDQAIAAIEAMREPTKDMIDAGDMAMTGELLIPGDSRGPWSNMIDAALK
jgi:hypothetical protein